MATNEIPDDLAAAVGRYTNMPWWNGQAYAEFRGMPQALRAYADGVGEAVDDLHDVMDWLREEKDFAKSDRLRVIAGRLARLIHTQSRPDMLREKARTYSDPLIKQDAATTAGQ